MKLRNGVRELLRDRAPWSVLFVIVGAPVLIWLVCTEVFDATLWGACLMVAYYGAVIAWFIADETHDNRRQRKEDRRKFREQQHRERQERQRK